MKQLSRSQSAGKVLSPAALAFAAGLVLAVLGSAVQAASNPIMLIVIIVLKNDPSGFRATTQTDKNGVYQFNNLKEGSYNIIIPGQPARSVSVGKDGMLRGQIPGAAATPGAGSPGAFGGQTGSGSGTMK